MQGGNLMRQIKIEKTTKCDTRSLDKNFTEIDVMNDTIKHQRAVIAAFNAVVQDGKTMVLKHDHTKLENLSMFTRALRTGFQNDEFRQIEWYKDIHIIEERHHLNDHCPADVNLMDVLEMLCDCVTAGLARTGNVYEIKIDSDILQRAVANTVDLLKENIVVLDDPTPVIIDK